MWQIRVVLFYFYFFFSLCSQCLWTHRYFKEWHWVDVVAITQWLERLTRWARGQHLVVLGQEPQMVCSFSFFFFFVSLLLYSVPVPFRQSWKKGMIRGAAVWASRLSSFSKISYNKISAIFFLMPMYMTATEQRAWQRMSGRRTFNSKAKCILHGFYYCE